MAKAVAGLQAALSLVAENKVQLAAEQQVVYTAELAAGVLANRKPKFKAKLKVLAELAAKAEVVSEVPWVIQRPFQSL